ncbi:MAG: tRNA lysidine(34) synthetase TilS [Butyrivibrio sp.]|nr:tRNA lysidine(34) synthetase TilS [Butyrivibrio sp.]
MNNFEERAYKYIKKYNMINDGDTILAGISGGADSVCLLLILCKIRERINFKLQVCHVNHGIRTDASNDADYVKKLCDERNIAFHLIEEDVTKIARDKNLTEEEAGRIVRYEAFDNILKSIRENEDEIISKNDLEKKAIDSVDTFLSGYKIAIAHHQGDVAETMLLNLFRGSGIVGATGIRPVRDNIIRPVLFATRSEIEEYLEEKNISFCTDSTNLEDEHARNRIRHNILPLAEREINSAATRHIAEFAESMSKAFEYIDGNVQKLLQDICEIDETEVRVDLEKLDKETDFIKEMFFLKVFEKLTPHRKDITRTHIEILINLVENRNGSRGVDLPYNIKAVREYDKLVLKIDKGNCLFTKKTQNNETDIIINSEMLAPKEYEVKSLSADEIKIDGLGTVKTRIFEYKGNEIIPEGRYTKWFDYDKIQKVLKFRIRQSGDYMTFGENNSTKSLKKMMIDEKIPASKRNDMYILADGDHILWLPGYRISSFYKIDENTRKILEISVQEIDKEA